MSRSVSAESEGIRYCVGRESEDQAMCWQRMRGSGSVFAENEDFRQRSTQIQVGKQIPYKFLLHPLLSAEPDLNPATNGVFNIDCLHEMPTSSFCL